MHLSAIIYSVLLTSMKVPRVVARRLVTHKHTHTATSTCLYCAPCRTSSRQSATKQQSASIEEADWPAVTPLDNCEPTMRSSSMKRGPPTGQGGGAFWGGHGESSNMDWPAPFGIWCEVFSFLSFFLHFVLLKNGLRWRFEWKKEWGISIAWVWGDWGGISDEVEAKTVC